MQDVQIDNVLFGGGRGFGPSSRSRVVKVKKNACSTRTESLSILLSYFNVAMALLDGRMLRNLYNNARSCLMILQFIYLFGPKHFVGLP